MKRIIGKISVILLAVAFLYGCEAKDATADTVNIVIEEGEGFRAEPEVATVPVGGDVIIRLYPEKNWVITGCDNEAADISDEGDGSRVLKLSDVRYSKVITVDAIKRDQLIRYHLADHKVLEKSYAKTHLRINTEIYSDEFLLPGYTLAGWNTSEDMTGERIGLGSRVDIPQIEDDHLHPDSSGSLELFADYRSWSDEELFYTEPGVNESIYITGINKDVFYDDQKDRNLRELVIPEEIKGQTVVGIGEGAFKKLDVDEVVFPPSLKRVGIHAFDGSTVKSIVFFDNIEEISDHAFLQCESLREICINAAQPPAFSGTYYDTFTDKYDRLLSLKDKKKIVLFSGSSARFGYDCEMIDEAFGDYEVVNMGVFAYTNALPQLELIRPLMGEKDILLLSPEFDAKDRQFCTTNRLDDKLYCMIESNYDLLRKLDYREYGDVLSSFLRFRTIRKGMEDKDYELSAKDFDEDGNPVAIPSYNEYGDYTLYRGNASDDTPIYDLPVDYVKEAFPYDSMIEPFNRECDRYKKQKVEVLFTYAPRNRDAISERSSEEKIEELDAYLREMLTADVISEIKTSLYPGRYLYGTDNHLSTEGVKLRTERIIKDIKRWMDR